MAWHMHRVDLKKQHCDMHVWSCDAHNQPYCTPVELFALRVPLHLVYANVAVVVGTPNLPAAETFCAGQAVSCARGDL